MSKVDREDIEELIRSETIFQGGKNSVTDSYKSQMPKINTYEYSTPKTDAVFDVPSQHDYLVVDYRHGIDHVETEDAILSGSNKVLYQFFEDNGPSSAGTFLLRDLSEIAEKLERGNLDSVFISRNPGKETLGSRARVKFLEPANYNFV